MRITLKPRGIFCQRLLCLLFSFLMLPAVTAYSSERESLLNELL